MKKKGNKLKNIEKEYFVYLFILFDIIFDDRLTK